MQEFISSSEVESFRTQAQQILSHPTWDIVTIFAFVAIGFFYAISAGGRRVAVTILYSYVAYAVSMALPTSAIANIAKFFSLETFVAQIALFFIILLVLIFSFRKRSASPDGRRAWARSFFLSMVLAGFLIHIVFNFFPAGILAQLSPVTRFLFADPATHFWWFISPVSILILLRWADRQ